MRWENLRRSTNVEDRRGAYSGGLGMAGSGGGLLFMALIVYLLGGDPTGLVIEGASRMIVPGQVALSPEEEKTQADFTAAVLGNTEDVWGQVFSARGSNYQAPVLTLFTGAVDSQCGYAQAAMGPFYCPLDQKVYLDLSFFRDMERKMNAPGDFARAYVIAHEVGHHVQKLEGTADRVHRQRERAGERTANALSVKMELQADCYAGVWAYHAQSQFGAVEDGDIQEALNAATQIGDDRLQQQSQGYVVPDAFTHGSSAQRYQWFQTGFQSGKTDACDTFNAAKL
ncbi:MAG: zinc metallopeptidase [bacterium]|nr:zinc metallopeptidase [bacterium]